MDTNISNYGWGLPVQASSYAKMIDGSLHIMHGVMMTVFVLCAIFMTFCLIRYRRKEGVPAIYSHHTPLISYTLDAFILAFDIWIIFWVGVPLWGHIREELPKPEDATVVSIVAEQFVWNIHYPGPDKRFGQKYPKFISPENPLGIDETDPYSKDDVTTINELYLPLGKPALINLTSKDVIHSFFVPEFRTKQDAVPGMDFSIWVKPILIGKFEIACAQLCGLGHYQMIGNVLVTTPEEFNLWIKQKIEEKG